MTTITKPQVDLSAIPAPDAGWKEIERFARGLDMLSFHGSAAKCREIASLRVHDSLENLLTCLFYEQRRWSQCEMMGISPGRRDISYMRELVAKIRQMAGAAQGWGHVSLQNPWERYRSTS